MNIERLVNVDEIENAVMSVSDYIDSNNGIRKNWNNFSEYKLWVILVSCILGSRVRFETANACIEHLRKNRLLMPKNIINDPKKFRKIFDEELSKPIFPPYNGNKGCRYRYSKSKADYIVRTALKIYKTDNSNLKEFLTSNQDEYETRDSLIENAVGIGYKQASLFLRNIYFAQNLAILDSHVIRYMILLEIIDNDTELKLSNKRAYIEIENHLQEYATSNNRSISTLDIAIWIVMRLVQREYIIWE